MVISLLRLQSCVEAGVSGNQGYLLSGPDNEDPTIWGYYMGVSGNEGFLLSGPDNKDPTIWGTIWGFPKIRGTLFWVLIIRILLFGVLY